MMKKKLEGCMVLLDLMEQVKAEKRKQKEGQ